VGGADTSYIGPLTLVVNTRVGFAHRNGQAGEAAFHEAQLTADTCSASPKWTSLEVDALGNPLPTPGQVHDSTLAEALKTVFVPGRVIADQAYDTNQCSAFLGFRAEAVIPSLGSRRERTPYDKHRYKKRRLVETSSNKIRHFRRVTTRYNKIAASFLAFVAIASFIADTRAVHPRGCHALRKRAHRLELDRSIRTRARRRVRLHSAPA
jgi:transposase